MGDQVGDVGRYMTLELTQEEYDVLMAARLKVQLEKLKQLTWPEFVLELARRAL